MKLLICSLVALLGIAIDAKDVFRYVDEETGQSHYMTGDPGNSVEGGWTFTNADGTFELVYKADEGGFQPEAEHIPVAVEDTNEVADAKATFYSLYKEHEAKVKAALEEEDVEVEDAVVEVAKREAEDNDVFRYTDEETGQSHYMTGIPGKSVEGGWTFTNGDKTYELVYKADEGGFQPKAEHIPVAVEDTNEVAEAKNVFYSLYKEHEAKVKAALEEADVEVEDAVVEVAKREAEEDEGEAEPEAEVEKMEEEPMSEKMVYAHGHLFGQPLQYSFHPYLGFVPNYVSQEKSEETEASEEPQDVEYKFVPYYGFVKIDEADKEAEDEVRYKFDPLYGFVQVKKEGEEEEKPMVEPMEEQEYKYVPYVGFLPLTAEDKESEEKIVSYKFNPFYGFVQAANADEVKESEEVKYKFVPYYGFVPVNMKMEEDEGEAVAEGAEEEEAKPHHLQYVFHPYHGYLPTLVQKPEQKENEQLYTYDHMRGFVPVPMEEEAEEVEEEARRKKRDAQVFLYPHQYVPYYPTYVVPTVATQAAKKVEAEEEEKPETLPEVVDNQKVPLPGLVQVQLVQTPVLQAAQPLVVVPHPVLPLPTDQYPVIPNDPEQEEQGAFEF